jgi:hypothetical protein
MRNTKCCKTFETPGIIPMQTPGANLTLSRGNPFTLLVAQSATGNATGNLFWDDGDSIGKYIFSNKINHTHFLCFMSRTIKREIVY